MISIRTRLDFGTHDWSYDKHLHLSTNTEKADPYKPTFTSRLKMRKISIFHRFPRLLVGNERIISVIIVHTARKISNFSTSFLKKIFIKRKTEDEKEENFKQSENKLKNHEIYCLHMLETWILCGKNVCKTFFQFLARISGKG